MGFMSYHTPQHCCYVSDALASPLQVLHKSFSTSSQFSDDQDATSEPPFSMSHLSKWRVTSISEWQSNCTKTPSTKIGPSQEDVFAIRDFRNLATCRCSATHLCGPYLVVELSRTCGCLQSVQVMVNAYSERFIFLDGAAVAFPAEGDFLEWSEDADSSSEDNSVDWLSTSTRISEGDGLSSFPSQVSDSGTQTSSGNNSPPEFSEFFVKRFQFPLLSKRFSLVDLALLLSAVQQEHADHRWTDSYADRSLIEFTSAEVFSFLDYFLELDWRHQILEYRRSIAKRFYDKRVMAWNKWISNSSSKLIDGKLLLSPLSPSNFVGPGGHIGSPSQAQELDHERRLLSCMKDRVSFVNDELRLLWMSLAAQKCALQASKIHFDEGEP